MANIRCFDLNSKNLTASERSVEKRQQTIYNDIQQNILKNKTANPVKNNGSTYNSNTIVNQTCDISYGYVEVATSYVILEDVKNGAKLCNPVKVIIPDILSDSCSSECSNTFDSGFQDTGDKTNDGQSVTISGVDVINARLAVYDASATLHLANLDTNANRDASWNNVGGPALFAATTTAGVTDMGIGPTRYRNATFIGECNISTYTTPMFVFQFSQDYNPSTLVGTWFSDGIEPSFFALNPTTQQFCFQRSNVPTRWVRLYTVNNTYFNKIQLVLTKN